MKYIFSSCVNYGECKGFDAFIHNSNSMSFCLSDGANSVPFGDLAAQLACKELTALSNTITEDLLLVYANLNQLLRQKYPDSACTSAHIKFNGKKILISHCGDTLIEIFQIKNLGLPILGGKTWVLDWHNELDEINFSNNPSQLLGSNAYKQAHIKIFEFNRPKLILLSTDGLHRHIKFSQRLAQINNIDQAIPSEYDLEYICHTLAQDALDSGSKDDISVVAIWCAPS